MKDLGNLGFFASVAFVIWLIWKHYVPANTKVGSSVQAAIAKTANQIPCLIAPVTTGPYKLGESVFWACSEFKVTELLPDGKYGFTYVGPDNY